MENSQFDFVYCPECGGDIKLHGLFTTGKGYFAGRGGICRNCGKEWHVLWENCADFEEESED